MHELLVKIGVPALVFIAMAIVGTELTVDDFRRMLRSPWMVVVAILGQCVLLPGIGLLLIRCCSFQPTIADGLLLVVACPSGAMANVYNSLGRANVALSVTLTTVSCLVAVVSTPVVLAFLKTGGGEIADFPVPLGVLTGQLVLLLIVPVVAGMAIRRRWPEISKRHGRTCLCVGIAAFAALLGLVIAQETARFVSAFSDIVTATIMLTVLAFSAGWGIAWLCGSNRVDRFTVGMVYVIRNTGIATAIAVTVLGRMEFAVFATAYLLAQMPILIFAVVVFRYSRKNDGSQLLGASDT